MLYDIVNAEYIENYKIKISFENGRYGVVDFSDYVKKGGVFNKFKNINFFKNFVVNNELGTIVWGDEIDVAPETLYEKCK